MIAARKQSESISAGHHWKYPGLEKIYLGRRAGRIQLAQVPRKTCIEPSSANNCAIVVSRGRSRDVRAENCGLVRASKGRDYLRSERRREAESRDSCGSIKPAH